LCQAGLVARRKDGRWVHFRLAGQEASPMARRALRWVLEALKDDRAIEGDAKLLAMLCCKNLEELSACYRS
jgi:hypothetical protein